MNKKLLALFIVLFLSAYAFSNIPAGYYYLANNQKGATLKSTLNEIISQGKFIPYGSGEGYTWNAFYYTDRNETDGTIYDMYSNTIRTQNDYNSVSELDIEHALPKSWWGSYQNNAYKDLHHLFPADKITNITKSALPLGEVIMPASLLDNGLSRIGKNGFTTSYTNNCFEPADEYKGDFARAYLYMATAYEELASYWSSPMMLNNTYPVFTSWAINLLLKWHRNDPVSEKEVTRNEIVYEFQGNRNPYIDYPDLVEHIWGNKTDQDFTLPQETNAFLITPNRWTSISFGVIMQYDAQQINIDFKGVNITDDIQLAIKNNNTSISLSTYTLNAADLVNGNKLSIFFDAQTLGVTADTLLVTSNQLTSLEIPIHVQVSDNFMTLAPIEISSTTATLNWMKYTNATHYTATIQQGAAKATDLFFSAYTEGTTGFNKAVAIYNGTGKPVDLSKYSLRKQSNGNGTFTSETFLSGTLDNNNVCVIAHYGATNITSQKDIILGENATDQTTVVSFNGNDAIALFHSGIMIDVIGEVDNPADWGKDMTIKRNATVVAPSTQFEWSNWSNVGVDVFENLHLHTAQFSTPIYVQQDMNVGNTTTHTLTGLLPENEYIYTITAVGSPNTTTVNSILFTTSKLETPLAIDASIIGDTYFEADWEEIPDATHYLIDLYELDGAEPIVAEEGFSDKAACIASGWDFGSTGEYVSSQYFGKASPAISFDAENKTMITCTYPKPVSQLNFMYRYGSATGSALGSTLAVDGFNGTVWVNIDSIKNTGSIAKTYPKYEFQQTDNYTRFRFVYAIRNAGNIGIDDIIVTYGSLDTTYLIQNQAVIKPPYLIESIKASTIYHYRVRAAINDYKSGFSNEITIKTKDKESIIAQTKKNIQITQTTNGISIEGLQANSLIKIYRANGVLLKQQCVNFSCQLDLPKQGIYILQILDSNNNVIEKIIW